MKNVAQILDRKGKNVISVEPDRHVLDALKIMAEKNIGSIAVIENGEYRGLMTERDYARKIILQGKTSSETKVGDIMSTDLPKINPQDNIDHCMVLMSDANIRYLPVFENNQLCGIISINDLVKETILDQRNTIEQLHNYIRST
ncbi:MAG: CBS domain-containing protein [Chitinophagaceae bacterium]|jgi:CBS domain-containing protein|nr:MAG: CBS domain-containing protein [Chitinophagaceae bacterium]